MSGSYIAYKITHTDSGLAYIGITTKGIKKRWSQHVADSKRYNFRLANAIQSYGPDGFSIEHIASATSSADLADVEVMLISQHGTLSPAGFNLTTGGGISPATTDAVRRKISNARTGTRLSAEHRANVSIGLTGNKRPLSKNVAMFRELNISRIGQKLTGEHLEKIRAAQRQIAASRIGVPLSDETKQRIGQKARLRWQEKNK